MQGIPRHRHHKFNCGFSSKECAIADTSATLQCCRFYASLIKSYGLDAKVPTLFFLLFLLFCFIWQQRPPSLPPSPWETLVPDSATSAMSTPCSCAMKPRTENIAKPDTKLVPLLRPPSSKQSLCHTYVMEVVNEHRRNRGSHFFFSFSRNRL